MGDDHGRRAALPDPPPEIAHEEERQDPQEGDPQKQEHQAEVISPSSMGGSIS